MNVGIVLPKNGLPDNYPNLASESCFFQGSENLTRTGFGDCNLEVETNDVDDDLILDLDVLTNEEYFPSTPVYVITQPKSFNEKRLFGVSPTCFFEINKDFEAKEVESKNTSTTQNIETSLFLPIDSPQITRLVKEALDQIKAFYDRVFDTEEKHFHGIQPIKYQHEVLFSQKVELDISKLKRWEPNIYIDPLLLEDNE